MSTRIYNGWRLRAGIDIWDEMVKIRAIVEERARTKLGALIRHYAKHDEDRRRDLGMSLVVDRAKRPTMDVLRRVAFAIYKKYHLQSESSMRNDFDFNASVGVCRVEGHHLVRHFEGDGVAGIFDFLEGAPGWDEFGYWDNTDRPNRVRASAWRERKRLWDLAMLPDGTPNNHAVFEFITPVWWNRINPYPLRFR